MYPDTLYAEGRGSFLRPVPIPVSNWDASPQVCITISCEWLPYVRGALQQLLLQSTWKTNDPSELLLIQSRVFDFIASIDECNSSTLPFTCDYDYLSSDGAWSLNPRGSGQSPTTNGEYVAGGGWFNTLATSTAGPATVEAVDIHKLFSPSIFVNHVQMKYDLNRGSFNFGPWQNGIVGYLSGSAQFTALVDSSSDSNGTGKTINWTGSATIDELRFVVVVGALIGGGEPGGSSAITHAIATGFGPSTC